MGGHLSMLLVVAGVMVGSKNTDMEAAPQISSQDGVMFGMLIDAGSTGSRLHLYQWSRREFEHLPPPLSLPVTSERWTSRLKPGISHFADDPEAAADALVPLVEYAMKELAEYEDQWSEFPIYVKATAGMRELADEPRLAVMSAIRTYLRECPFAFFADENARVISGEEEATYAWVSANFVDGALFEALDQGSNFGTAKMKRARGSLEMGGSSSQIAFYNSKHDVLSNLFKMQLGASAHVNLYAHSFLHYGRVTSRRMVWSDLGAPAGCWSGEPTDTSQWSEPVPCTFVDECLLAGVEMSPSAGVTDDEGLPPPLEYEPLNRNVTIHGGYVLDGTKATAEASFEKCLNQTRRALFVKERNKWCKWAHQDQCAFNGVYQPPLPSADDTAFGGFVLFGGYYKLFHDLRLADHSSLEKMREVAAQQCALGSVNEPKNVAATHDDDERPRTTDKPAQKMKLMADELCFVAALAYAMLVDGHGFEPTRTFTALETAFYDFEQTEVKVGWPLGAMLYEINALPWSFKEPEDASSSKRPTDGDEQDKKHFLSVDDDGIPSDLLDAAPSRAFTAVVVLCGAIAITLCLSRSQKRKRAASVIVRDDSLDM